MKVICIKYHEEKKHLYYLFFPKLQHKYKQNIKKMNIQQCYNTEVCLKEGKIRELTEKGLAEDHVDLIVKSIKNKSLVT